MPFADYLIDRCTVERATLTEYDDGSQQETWVEHLVLLPCRYVVQQERVAGPNGLMMATVTKLITSQGLDVTSADRVKSIVLAGSSTLGTHTIESVVPRIGARSNHHLELIIEKVQ